MDFPQRARLLTEALASGDPLPVAAERFGVTLEELELWAELHARTNRPVRGSSRWLAPVLAGLVALGAGLAVAANGTCPNGLPFCIPSNSPAVASQANHNFAQLKEWLEQKTGALGNADLSSASLTSNSIQVPSGNQGTQLLWNTILPGAGQAELVNNRGLGGGSFGFYDRAGPTTSAGAALVTLAPGSASFQTQVGGNGRLCVMPVDCEDSPAFACGGSTTCPNNKFMTGFTDGTGCSVVNKARCCAFTLTNC